MAPQDACYLLLALMYDDELAFAEQSASHLAEAKLIACRHQIFGQEARLDDHPRNGFFGNPESPLSFGEVVATIIDWFVRYGDLEEGEDHDLDLDVVNLTVSVSHPGHTGRIHFNTHEGFWTVTYSWRSAEQLAFEEANPGKLIAPSWDARNGPAMWSERTVGEDSLRVIADCLRGSEWDEGWEEFDPPYDESCGTERQVEIA